MNSHSVQLNTSESPDYRVAAVRKALELLCQFSSGVPHLSVSELSRRLELPKSTTHNLLRTLESLEFLRQDPADRRYRLGPRVYELGLCYAQTSPLVSAAASHLRRLAEQTRETVKLAMLAGDEILVVAAVESPYQLHTRGDLGMRALLHCTGLGKAILSQLGAEAIRAVVGRHGLARITPRTITTRARLGKELEQVRKEGYAIDREENEPGVICVAAPIAVHLDRSLAAISVSGPISRVDERRTEEFSALVRECARAIEKSVGSHAARKGD